MPDTYKKGAEGVECHTEKGRAQMFTNTQRTILLTIMKSNGTPSIYIPILKLAHILIAVGP